MVDPARFTQADVDYACEQAILAVEQDLLPFHGVDQVAFRRDLPHLQATIVYERELLLFLHRIMSYTHESMREVGDAEEAQREVARRRTERVHSVQGANRLTTGVKRTGVKAFTAGDVQRADQRLKDAVRIHADQAGLCAVLDHEIEDVRVWLDEQLEAGDAYKLVRASARRDTCEITTAVSYSLPTFLAEDPPGRELRPGSGQVGGATYGDRWSWELPHQPWQTTTWSAFWLDNGEICVRDTTGPGDFVRDPDEEILLLGRVPRARIGSAEDFIGELQATVSHERNSLILLARAVFDAQRSAQRRADD